MLMLLCTPKEEAFVEKSSSATASLDRQIQGEMQTSATDRSPSHPLFIVQDYQFENPRDL